MIGPSGSGKSSLARLLVGAGAPARGKVRLDGAALDQWARRSSAATSATCRRTSSCSRHRGAKYLPVRARADPEAIVAAAEAAGVHDLIVALPRRLRDEIGERRRGLSAGQASASR